jgi:hypothetical protein
MSAGLAIAGTGLLLMSGIKAGSEWTTLLGGFRVLGAGVGLLNPIIADVAMSVVPKERSGMAAGINDTFRPRSASPSGARSSSRVAPTRSASWRRGLPPRAGIAPASW